MSVPNLLVVVFLQAILGKPERAEPVARHRRDKLDEHCEGGALRGAPAPRQRVCGGGALHGRRFFPHPDAPSDAELLLLDHVHGGHERAQRHCGRVNAQLHGHRLPLEVISWGSMLSLSEKALMTDAWWIILIPGLFLVATLLSITSIGNDLRRQANRKESNL